MKTLILALSLMAAAPHIQTTSPYSVGQAVAEEVSRRTSNAILVMARRWNNDLSATFGILDRLNYERPSPELEDAIDNVKHLKVQVAAFMLGIND